MNNNTKGLLVLFLTISLALLLSVGIIYGVCLYRDYLIINKIPYDVNTDSSTTFETYEPSAGFVAPATTEAASSAELETFEEPTSEEASDYYTFPWEFITVDDSYFEDAVFIGDSRMRGFIKYCGLTGLRAYAYMGLDVDKYFTAQIFRVGDSTLSASEALELDCSFSKVYIMLGTNELGWIYPEVFIRRYEKIIAHIRECNPDAVIFVESVLPVAADAYQTTAYLKNETVWHFNELLEQMALENEVYYLDLAHVVANEEGVLPAGGASDGIHPNPDYVLMCLDYMKEHGIQPIMKEEETKQP